MAPPKGFRLSEAQRAKISLANQRHWQSEDYRRKMSRRRGEVRNVSSGQSLRQRLDFYSMPEPNSGCLLWVGPVDGDGYGLIRWKGETLRAHRAAYEDEHGPLSDGLQACHRCDVRSCIELRHLFPGTNAENTADKMSKGRHRCDPLLGEDAPAAKLTARDVLAIRASSESQRSLASRYDVNKSQISRIKNRVDWRHV